MEDRSLFISSCSRRQLARRRNRSPVMTGQLMLVVIVLAAVLGALVAANGGL